MHDLICPECKTEFENKHMVTEYRFCPYDQSELITVERFEKNEAENWRDEQSEEELFWRKKYGD